MQSRAVRLILLLLFVAAILTSTFLFRKGSTAATSAALASKTFDDAVQTIERGLFNLRAAQPAYASANQPAERWTGKIATELETVRAGVQSLRAEATAPEAQAALDRVAGSLNDFAKSNLRAAAYAKNGDRTLASDVVFGEGLEQTGAALDSMALARAAELKARDATVSMFRSRQGFAVAAGAAASVLVVLLLVPVARPHPSQAPVVVQKTVESPQTEELLRDYELDNGIMGVPNPAAAPEPVLASLEPSATSELMVPAFEIEMEEEPASVLASMSAAPETDFGGVASLCIELARVVDTRALPSLLDRTAELLDASGIILWIADPDGRELNPIFAQGYPQHLVNRLGTIPRDAENATAAAFRTSLLQTVMADDISGGAIAAPLVTPGGCVGVMAAEVRHDSERQDAKLAAATIVAAQLATLVGPPSARPQARSVSGA
ncbi:MAG: GAF domain-containing protein [Vicinamibacterales bacterium]